MTIYLIVWFDIREDPSLPSFWGTREEVVAELERLRVLEAAVEEGEDYWDSHPMVLTLEAGNAVSGPMTPEEFLG